MKTRRTLAAEHAGMRAIRDAALEREARALADAGRATYRAKVAERRAASAEAAAKRTHDRNQVLGELLDEARRANGDYDLDRMEARLERALRAVARLRAENAEQRREVRSITDQLFHAMGHTDAELRLLGVDPANNRAGRVA